MVTAKFEQPLKSQKTNNYFHVLFLTFMMAQKLPKMKSLGHCVNTSGNYFTSDNHWISAQSDIHSIEPYPVQNGLDPSIFSHFITVFFLAYPF